MDFQSIVVYFSESNLTKAIEYAEKSLLNNQYNLEGLQLLAVVYRLQHNAGKANELLNKINALDPLNHFVHFEKYLWENSESLKKHFISLIQNEMPQQTFLELGIWYQQLNLKNDALKVFSLAKPNAELTYWKAFLENKPVELSKIQLGISFPFRDETAEILEKLIQTNEQWELKYHLALIEWNRNNIDKAKKLFSQCGAKPMNPAFYAARASLMKNDSKSVIIDLQQAIKLDQKEWRYHKLLTENYILEKEYDKALTIVESFYKAHKDNYVMGILYAKTLLLTKKYAESDTFLTKLKILPFEGATMGRQLYHEAKLMQAVMEMKKKHYKKALKFITEAKQWPLNLGVGKPYKENIDERLEDWLDYKCYISLGDDETATQSLHKIVAFVPKVDNTVMNFLTANELVTAWAIEKISGTKKAKEWLEDQASLYPSNKIIQWCLQTYNQKQSDNLTEDEKDGEVRILEKLLEKR